MPHHVYPGHGNDRAVGDASDGTLGEDVVQSDAASCCVSGLNVARGVHLTCSLVTEEDKLPRIAAVPSGIPGRAVVVGALLEAKGPDSASFAQTIWRRRAIDAVEADLIDGDFLLHHCIGDIDLV